MNASKASTPEKGVLLERVETSFHRARGLRHEVHTTEDDEVFVLCVLSRHAKFEAVTDVVSYLLDLRYLIVVDEEESILLLLQSGYLPVQFSQVGSI